LNFDLSSNDEVQNSNFKIKSNFKLQTSNLQSGLFLALISLLIVNIFTPYLNHPLGIGAIMLVSVFASQAEGDNSHCRFLASEK